MKLLLTSTGLTTPMIRDLFIGQFDRLNDKTASVVTAGRSLEERKYIEASIHEMRDLGIETFELDISKGDRFENAEKTDIYYVCGGNTYYILDRIRKTGLDALLKSEIRNGKFYLGVSAGSIVVGPNIAIAGFGDGGDENDVCLEDLSGLGLVECIISPHFNKGEEEALKTFTAEWHERDVIGISDVQAVFVEDGKASVICDTKLNKSMLS
jgi:dipeptidase E